MSSEVERKRREAEIRRAEQFARDFKFLTPPTAKKTRHRGRKRR